MTSIRRATLEDAAALAYLAESTFRDTFSDGSGNDDMDRHCAASFSEEIQRKELQDSNYVTILAETEGKLIGFAQILLFSNKPCVEGESASELHRLYILNKWHGQGVAHQIMTEVLAVSAASCADNIWLGVWEHNQKAIAFYQKYGFSVVGEHVFQVGTDPQRDLVMALETDEQSAV